MGATQWGHCDPELLSPQGTVKEGGTTRQGVTSKISRVFTSPDANKRNRAPRFGQLGHTGESSSCIEVVEGGDRHHQVKGFGFELVSEEVPSYIADV